jgi:SAM-dependent methyltransferase
MILGLRLKTFYNADYFERVVLPLMSIPVGAELLDVGCGYGGLSFIIAGLRPDLHITGVDPEPAMLEQAETAAAQKGFKNVTFDQGDGHHLKYNDNQFEAVVCQTVLTHVDDAQAVVGEMARVLKPGGVFTAVEYTELGVPASYHSRKDDKRDETWYAKYFRLSRLFMQGKKVLRRGDDGIGIRVPLLATAAGLDVFDVRLNDRVLHIIPPYAHPKQRDYVEFFKAFHPEKSDEKVMTRTVEAIRAAGGNEDEGRWLYETTMDPGAHRAIEEQTLTVISGFMLFLTFARKQ